MNKCIFTGNLAADPEVKYTQSGKQVATFRIGVSCGYGDHKRTEWVTCQAWDKTAEIAGKYLQKGSKVLVVTELKTEKWKDKDGNDRYSQKYDVRELEFFGAKQEGQGSEPPPFQNSTGEEVPF